MEKQTESHTDDMLVQPIVFNLIESGKANFYIAYNFEDSQGRLLAKQIQNIFHNVTGIKPRVMAKGTMDGDYIFVGRAEGNTKLSQEDFMIDFSTSTPNLFSNSPGLTETMLCTFQMMLQKKFDSKNKSLVLTSEDTFLYSEAPDMVNRGNTLEIVKNKISEYVVACDSKNTRSMAAASYLSKALKNKFGVLVSVSDIKSVANKKKIIVGIKDSTIDGLGMDAVLDASDDFAVCVVEDDLIITGDNEKNLLEAIKYFGDKYLSGNVKELTISEGDDYIHSRFGREFLPTLKMTEDDYATFYREVFKTYARWIDDILANRLSRIPLEHQNDHALVMYLIERMGDAYVFSVDSSSFLHKGKICKLDVSDYSRKAIVKEGDVWLPKEFAKEYLNVTVEGDSQGFFNMTALCKTLGLTVFYDGNRQIAVVTPSDVATFDSPNTKADGRYSNKVYLDRMYTFFHSSWMPEPENNTEQSRVVIEHIEFSKNTLDYTTNVFKTTFSPSIAVDTINGQKIIYSSYEICEVQGVWDAELSTVTVVEKSLDDGATWTELGRVKNLQHATLFVHDHEVYLLGTNHSAGRCAMIARVKADGKTESQNLFGGASCGYTAPCAVVEHNGRIYKAYARRVISAPVDSNLMNPDNWTRSQDMVGVLSVDWMEKALGKKFDGETAVGGGEPNIVVGEDGELYCFWRFDRGPNLQLVLHLKSDGAWEPVEEINSIITDFPTTQSKLTIRYDAVTGKYITLSNIFRGGYNGDRGVLCIASSDDMFKWEINDYILVSREMENPWVESYIHAFQYVDFVIDGDDILMVVREAADFTCSFHDGNYTTFYRIENFRDLLK